MASNIYPESQTPRLSYAQLARHLVFKDAEKLYRPESGRSQEFAWVNEHSDTLKLKRSDSFAKGLAYFRIVHVDITSHILDTYTTQTPSISHHGSATVLRSTLGTMRRAEYLMQHDKEIDYTVLTII
jgi:hypothetical protein